MSLALLFHYLMLSMFRMLIHPSSGACDLFLELFHGLYCSGSMRVGITLWFGWSGVVSGCGFQLQRVSVWVRTQTPGNYPKRNKLHLEHDESLKTRIFQFCFILIQLLIILTFRDENKTGYRDIVYVLGVKDVCLIGADVWRRDVNETRSLEDIGTRI